MTSKPILQGRIYFSTSTEDPIVFPEENGGNVNHFLDTGAVSYSP
jgi:hypothetical protein